MMMQMLQAGGLPVVSDGIRTLNEHNPRGYFELEAVKSLHENADVSWLDDAAGKAVKIISFLLGWLPETNDYLVLFMRRDLHEVVASQHKMLITTGAADTAGDVNLTLDLYARHLQEISRLLGARRCFTALDVEYRDVVRNSREEASRVARFLGLALDVQAMATAVDPRLYRNRRGN